METTDPSTIHVPVFKKRCVEILGKGLEKFPVCIDATVGMGGHAEAILQSFPQVTVIGIDRDLEALTLSGKRLSSFGKRFIPVHTTYDEIYQVAQQYSSTGKVGGVLMDLGVSSLQIDQVERGFSYRVDAPLDMRMNQQEGQLTAQELLANCSQQELTKIILQFGEEKFANRIAKAVISKRQSEPIATTSQLVSVIREALPQAAMRSGGHPAKRTFQALRIAVNQELQILQSALPMAIESLGVGGVMVVESYHSLEDRLVKQAFSKGSNNSAPVDMPFVPPQTQPYIEPIIRGSQKADEEEKTLNSRSASVRLRAVRRIRNTPVHLLPAPIRKRL